MACSMLRWSQWLPYAMEDNFSWWGDPSITTDGCHQIAKLGIRQCESVWQWFDHPAMSELKSSPHCGDEPQLSLEIYEASSHALLTLKARKTWIPFEKRFKQVSSIGVPTPLFNAENSCSMSDAPWCYEIYEPWKIMPSIPGNTFLNGYPCEMAGKWTARP